MNDRKLIGYLPPVLQTVLEFMEITDAQQPEFEKAWAALDLVMANQFIDTATEEGVAVWEKELNITPLNTETLEARKQRIKTAWTYGVVYTYNWVVDWLKNSCGASNPPPSIDGYVLRTYLPLSSNYMQILDNMRRYVSANVLINPTLLLSKIEKNHRVGAAYRISTSQTIQSESWDVSNIVLLADEKGDVLIDENSEVLFEEATT